MEFIVLLIIWTWSLTPLWANITISVICGIKLILKFLYYTLCFIGITKDDRDI